MQTSLPLHILFCLEGSHINKNKFSHNHYVPLAVSAKANKNKCNVPVSSTISKKIKLEPLPVSSCKMQTKLPFFISNKSEKLAKIPTIAKSMDPIENDAFVQSKKEVISNYPVCTASISSKSSQCNVDNTNTILNNNNSNINKNDNSDSININVDVTSFPVKHKYDIANFLGINISALKNSEILNIIDIIYKPPEGYDFPFGRFKTPTTYYRLPTTDYLLPTT